MSEWKPAVTITRHTKYCVQTDNGDVYGTVLLKGAELREARELLIQPLGNHVTYPQWVIGRVLEGGSIPANLPFQEPQSLLSVRLPAANKLLERYHVEMPTPDYYMIFTACGRCSCVRIVEQSRRLAKITQPLPGHFYLKPEDGNPIAAFLRPYDGLCRNSDHWQ